MAVLLVLVFLAVMFGLFKVILFVAVPERPQAELEQEKRRQTEWQQAERAARATARAAKEAALRKRIEKDEAAFLSRKLGRGATEQAGRQGVETTTADVLAVDPTPDPLSVELARVTAELNKAMAFAERREASIVHLKGQLAAAEQLTLQWQTTYRRKMEEIQAAGLNKPTAEPEGQFRRLRALIVKELHPDHAPSGSVDRALRAEVFKVIWPKIEEIDGRVR